MNSVNTEKFHKRRSKASCGGVNKGEQEIEPRNADNSWEIWTKRDERDKGTDNN